MLGDVARNLLSCTWMLRAIQSLAETDPTSGDVGVWGVPTLFLPCFVNVSGIHSWTNIDVDLIFLEACSDTPEFVAGGFF
eukprot:1793411-Amphidinium_carterae.1